MCLPPRIFEWGPQLKIISATITITVPSLMLLPQSAQFSYFFTPYGWTISRTVDTTGKIEIGQYLSSCLRHLCKVGLPSHVSIKGYTLDSYIDRLTICVKNTLKVKALSFSNLDGRPSRPLAFNAFNCTNY